MDLLKLLQASGQQDKIVSALGQKFGIEGAQADNVMAQVMGALGGGVEKTAQQNGLNGLMDALGQGNAEKALENPDNILNAEDDVRNEGNNILGQILGSKDASRGVAAQVAGSSGVDQSIIQQMMPMIATMAMGAMSKKAGGAQGLAQMAQGNGSLGSIMSMLDQDNDGSPVDDVMGMLGGLMGKK